MDRYSDIKEKLKNIAENDEQTEAVIFIGSATRTDVKADEFSDLDVVIVTEYTEQWLYGDYPERLGKVHISFVEPTLGGGKERRLYYDEYRDVDMILLTPEQFCKAVDDGTMSCVMNRGYDVLYDSAEYSSILDQRIVREVHLCEFTEEEFSNMVNDFFFHNIWAAKKMLRGELWSAKMCVDAYLKQHLLRMIEMYSLLKYNVDTWHDGRFLDRWADETIKKELEKCFANYSVEDMKIALYNTAKLFASLSKSVADMKGYDYPQLAEKYAFEYLEKANIIPVN